jgi:hypothetical protein
MLELRRFPRLIFAVCLVSCVSTEPVGGTPDESSSGSHATETGTPTTQADTDSATTEPTETTEGDTSTDTGVEDMHVSFLDDCGFELACEPMLLVDQIYPESAYDCTQSMHGAGQPGLVRVARASDGGNGEPFGETAYLFMADRNVLRQARDRDCGGPGLACDADAPWFPWQTQEFCPEDSVVDGEFIFTDCEPIDDYSCEVLAGLLAAEPEPSIPCEERSMAQCEGPLDGTSYCTWTHAANYPSDSCEPTISGMCLAVPFAPVACEENPTCEGAAPADEVLYRERGDGTVDIWTGLGCWAPLGFERCSWGEPGSDDPPGELMVGPAACDCAC